MPSWRCPHCGAPQPESARCWVCRRSTTCCSTCRHFRRAVAGGLGYCGLDRRRAPLTGDEIRGCWQAAREGRAVAEAAPRAFRAERGLGSAPRRVEFVPVDQVDLAAPSLPARPITGPMPNTASGPPDPTAPLTRFVLWDDPEA